jgi:mycothiol synthase
MRHILKIHRSLAEPIPSITHSYSIRTFNPATDKQQWLELNNTIFAHHPDQGNWAMADLENRMAERWFDADGFFLAVQGEKIIGFCWTKIHDEFVNQDPIGELYVIGVHPEHAHKGIGRAVSIEALNYLVNKGLKQSMLYVDADNEKGLALYKSLGFN